jgi:hypothetical protein
MPYKVQYGLAIGVAIAGALIGAVNAAGPQALGITQQAINWLNIIVPALVIVASVLPNLRRPPAPNVHYRD